MKILKWFFLLIIFSANTFAAQAINAKLPPAYALKGTSTAVVGIALDEKGFPVETVSKIVLKPGQKVIFAGPDRFQLVFKNRKSPSRAMKYSSKNGVVTVAIPADIFEQKKFIEEAKRNETIRFDYSIIVNGQELDPPMIIQRGP